jgi:uncharacterized protein YcbK (DUF882 family)
MKYFSHKEFDQKGLPNSGRLMKERFLRGIDGLREMCGFPFHITSGYRTYEYNKSIGGSRNSYHTRGMAADVLVKTPEEIYTIVTNAKKFGFYGIGISFPKDGQPGFVHLDIRAKYRKAMWGY